MNQPQITPEAQKRANELTQIMEKVEEILLDEKVTVGEWNMISEAMNNRQNSMLTKELIKKYVEAPKSNITKP